MQREIDQVVRAILDGFTGPELKAKMNGLHERKVALDGQLAASDDAIPILHPNMAEMYWAKVEPLRLALEREDNRAQAAEALRGLLDGIVLTPRGKASRSC